MTNTRRFGIALVLACLVAMCATGDALAAAKKPAVPAVKVAKPVEQLPDMTPEQAFELLKTWDYDQPTRPLVVLERYIGKASSDPAAKQAIAEKLAAVLADPKSPDGARKFACQQMALVGSDAQVPVLAKLLADAKTADNARLALEAIPGEASVKALRDALGQAKGAALAGIANSLGDRRDEASADALAALLADADAQVAVAAAKALGKIGSAKAADALAKAQPAEKLQADFRDAQFRCGENLLAAGNRPAAAGLYQQILKSNPPARLLAAALAGLVKADPAAATPMVMDAIGGKDELLCASAMQMTRDMPGPAVTTALVAQLPKLSPAGQAVLLGVLADRADRSAAAEVAKCLASAAPAVRAAAAKALGALGDASAIEPLAQLACEPGETQLAARAALAKLTGADIDARMLALAEKGAAALRAEMLQAIAARRTAGASAVLLKAAADADEKVRVAALDALAVVGEAGDYAKMVPLLHTSSGETALAAERAIVAVGLRMENPAERTAPVLEALKTAPAAAKAAVLHVLGGLGGVDALKAVCAADADADAIIRDAAIRTLANWPDESAGPELLVLAQQAEKPAHKMLAMQGYIRLARGAKEPAARLAMLKQACPAAKSPEARRMILGGLSDAEDAGSLDLALTFLADADVREEASIAVVKIGKALAAEDRAAVMQTIAKLKDAPGDKAVNDRTAALLAEAMKAPAGKANDPAALKHDQARSDAIKKELAAKGEKAFKGFHLACYLDCGPDVADGAKDGPSLNLLKGQTWHWPGADGVASARFATIAFGKEVSFQASGLNPKKTYVVGFSWWDFDHTDRVQSVVLGGKGGKEVKVVDRAALPSYAATRKLPEEKNFVVPQAIYADGSMKINFRSEAGANCVVCELWLWESDAEGAAAPVLPAETPRAAVETPAVAPAPVASIDPAAAPKVQPFTGSGKTKVLLVTGDDYPGHKWKVTAPALAGVLKKDARLDVQVCEDPNVLASPTLKDCDVVVLHWMNWKKPDPGEAARANLKSFVEGGKGLVLVHFACGAFQGWDEFGKIAGRAYNPKLRGHDPMGVFEVRMTDVKHPITEGMKPFKTTDELYTCVEGDAKIEVLVQATSKVDKKDYPLAFVLTYGKGRVFHCLLGHNAEALENEGPAELYRRGTAWVGGLTPVEK